MRKKFSENVYPYWQALPLILKYQIPTKICIGLWMFVLGKLFTLVVRSSGRVAITSSDFLFMFTSWQGILLIILAIATLFIYTAFDINTKIIFSKKLLFGEERSVLQDMKEGFFSIRRFLCPAGIGVVIYLALVAPLLGFGASISLTENFYIPTFITSVIESTPLLLILVSAALLVLLIIGLSNIFIIHGIVLDKKNVKEAGNASKALMKAHWKNYLKENLLYIAEIAAVIIIVIAVTLVLPLVLISIIPMSEMVRRALTILFVLIGSTISGFTGMFATPLYLMKITQLYYSYQKGGVIRFQKLEKKKHFTVICTVVIYAAVIAAGTAVLTNYFDDLFPKKTTADVIAHRGGGNEGPENTVAGLLIAAEAGASGSEIDIQRTSDGYYVVNHDGTFARTAGDNRAPEEMTLAEVKELSVDGEPVATFEEMLEAARGRLTLYTELKGNTADQQMADEAVRIIKEMGMEDECVLISLKYDLIDYIESTYPEIRTSYLLWLSFGDTASLNCDSIGLEEESATSDTISSIHAQGKQALVWTANEKDSQKHFLCSEADGIITDNVYQATELIEELENRSDLDRIIDTLLGSV